MANEVRPQLSLVGAEEALGDLRRSHSFDGGDGGGYDRRMEERVKKLEEFATEASTDLRAIDTRLIKIESRLDQMATKADLSDAMNGQIKWMVATAAVLGGTAIVVMTFVLNNAVPKAATQSTAPPSSIVVYAHPAPQASAAPAPPSAK
jgi:hypothetical protein